MGTHAKQKSGFHVFNRSGSPNWWMWWSNAGGQRVQRSTGLSKSEFTREQAQLIVSSDDPENTRLREKIFSALQNIVHKGTLEELLEITRKHSDLHEDVMEQARRTVPELGNGSGV